MKLAICTAGSKNYLYAIKPAARAIFVAASYHDDVHFIFSTDFSKESEIAETFIKNEIPKHWKLHILRQDITDNPVKLYDEAAQLIIAKLQNAAFCFASTQLNADLCWSVESDIISPANSLRVLEWALKMPKTDGSPYYHIAAATYPNDLFLCGFGTQKTPINEDFTEEERIIPKRFKILLTECKARIKNCEKNHTPPPEKEIKRLARLNKKIKKYPPDGKNVWEVTAKYGWRRRGWFDFAYPGIGKGAVVPVDWCGLGCTLLNKEALLLADFNGYDGKGTQDLFLCWNRWHTAGLNIACVPHVVCDHIKRDRNDPNKYVHLIATHELEGEYRGHLRATAKPWIPI